MKQIFKHSEIEGKIIKEVIVYSHSAYMSLLFTDNTYIKFRADANDGWGNEGSLHVIETEEPLEE